jgi:predicted HTH transcriptional regulator
LLHALQSAKVPDTKVSKHQSTADFGALDDALVQKILEVLRHKPEISQGEMAEELGTTRRVIQKKMILLKEAGCIECIGGDWKICASAYIVGTSTSTCFLERTD